MTFKEGGAFDFHSNFERVKETLSQALEEARESGRMPNGNGQLPDFSAAHLEQLPAYEDIGASPAAAAPVPVQPPSVPIQQPTPRSPKQLMQHSALRTSDVAQSHQDQEPVPGPSQQQFEPPDGPPPGYEEAQQGRS